MAYIDKLRQRAGRLKADIYVLYLARRDPRIRWYAKALLLLVVGYALSPIDLIPDFIPVVGYLDDLVLVPLGIALVMRMIPREVWRDYKKQALELAASPAKSRLAALAVIAIWLIVLAWLANAVYRVAS
ncbi:MAG: YkvA family protein [Thermoleophilia bacterium]